MYRTNVYHGLLRTWPSFKHKLWKFDSLRHRFGNIQFSCGMSSSNEPVLIQLNEFLARNVFDVSTLVHRQDLWNMPYIFDPAFEIDCEDMLNEYEIPSNFSKLDCLDTIPLHLRPDYRWLLIGGIASGTIMHVDPCNTSAWNALLEGSKLWISIDLSPHAKEYLGHHSSSHSYTSSLCDDLHRYIKDLIIGRLFGGLEELPKSTFLANVQQSSHCSNQSLNSEIIRFLNDLTCQKLRSCADYNVSVFVQQEGDVVYVPAGSPHAVLNLSPTVAITHNFLESENIDDFLRLYRMNSMKNLSIDEYQLIEDILQSKRNRDKK